MSTHRIPRRPTLTTPAAAAALLALAAPAGAQSRAAEPALVRVEVVAAAPAPVTRSLDAGWNVDAAGTAYSWHVAVEVDPEAVIALVLAGDGPDAEEPGAELAVRESGSKRLADVTLRVGADGADGPAELTVTLRIER